MPGVREGSVGSMSFADSPQKVYISGGPTKFYTAFTATTLYVEKVFGGDVSTVVVANDAASDTITISYDGATVKAELMPKESIEINVPALSSIFIRGSAGGGNVRLWGW